MPALLLAGLAYLSVALPSSVFGLLALFLSCRGRFLSCRDRAAPAVTPPA